MYELHRYRAVAVEVTCPKQEQPLYWESHTTMTDAELRRRAQGWAEMMWGCNGTEFDHGHIVRITKVPEISTGARRA